MFLEMKEKTIFEEAQKYAYAYIESVFDRNVYPTEEALANLSVFNEALPSHTTNPSEVLALLHTHGSPATLPTIRAGTLDLLPEVLCL